MQELREDFRRPQTGTYSLAWRGPDGLALSGEARGIDISASGLGIESAREIKAGSVVYVQARDGSLEGGCLVVYFIRRGLKYHIGLESREEVENSPPKMSKPANPSAEPDYYDVLQISPKADLETIHRVFRIMAVRFHP